MTKRAITTLAAALALALGASGCAAGGEKTEAKDGAKIIKDGTLTVCTHLPYKPFQYNDGGKVVGFDVDLMDLVAKKLDARAEDLRHALRGHRVRPGPQHRQVRRRRGRHDDHRRSARRCIDFSDPYFDATQALLVQERAPRSSRWTTWPARRSACRSAPPARTTPRPTRPRTPKIEEFEDLALLTTRGQDRPGRRRRQRQRPCCSTTSRRTPTPLWPPSSTPASSTASRSSKDRTTSCCKTINEAIADAKSDGTYDKIYKKCFGEAPEPVTPRRPTRQSAGHGISPRGAAVRGVQFACCSLVADRRRGRLGHAARRVLRPRHRCRACSPRSITIALKNTLIYTALRVRLRPGAGPGAGADAAVARCGPYRWIATGYIEFFRGVPALRGLHRLRLRHPARLPGPESPAATIGSVTRRARPGRRGLHGRDHPRRHPGRARRASSRRPGRWACRTRRAMVSIVIPQAFRIVLPPLTNELILLTKDSSLVYVLGLTPRRSTS